MHTTKYIMHTSEISDSLDDHVVRLAICVYLRNAKLATSFNVTPLLMLSHYACYENAHRVTLVRLGGL